MALSGARLARTTATVLKLNRSNGTLAVNPSRGPMLWELGSPPPKNDTIGRPSFPSFNAAEAAAPLLQEKSTAFSSRDCSQMHSLRWNEKYASFVTERKVRDLIDREGWVPMTDVLEGLFRQQRTPSEEQQPGGTAGGAVTEDTVDHYSGPQPVIQAIKRTFQPSTIRKKRKHGFLVRLKDEEGRKTIHRRRLKGRTRLSL